MSASDEATIIEAPQDAPAGTVGGGGFTFAQAGQSSPRGARKGHHHGPLDPEKALATGGLSFAPVYTEIDNADRATEVHWPFRIMSVGLQALTGVLTGVAAFVVSKFSESVNRFRLEVTLHLLRHGTPLLAWLASTGIMLALVLVGALPVAFWARSAGSSGIPSIIGLLNGCDLSAHFTWRILLVRLVGVMCAVASGLAVGPEGPMIYIGACTGALLSKIPSQRALWRYFGRLPSSLNEHVYLRDYVSTGAACGIAAAFRAPVAGALFVVEEAASHFRREHLAKIFLGGLVAMAVSGFLSNRAGHETAMFEYQVATSATCRTWEWLRAGEFIFFAIIGLVCGLAGALFNSVNVAVARLRARRLGPSKPLHRTAELVVICIVTSTSWVLMPSGWDNEPTGDPQIFSQGTRCIKDKWLPEVVEGSVVEGKTLRFWPKSCFYGVQYSEELCPRAWNQSDHGNQYAKICTESLVHNTGLETQPNKSFYCCSFSSVEGLMAGRFRVPGVNASCAIHLGESFPHTKSSHDSNTLDREASRYEHYNPMAALTLVSFDDTAKNLLSRGAPNVIPCKVMFAFLPVFFMLAAVTAGSAIPSGLLLPMIIIGALIGRILTMLLIQLQLHMSWYSSASEQSSMWSHRWQPFFHYQRGPLPDTVPFATNGWLDPGVGALVGAAAFLGGCSRISLMTTVMMVEITGDPVMIAPVGVATLVAVVVGNQWNHGLYHSLIDVASFPFMPNRWPRGVSRSLRVEHVLPVGIDVVSVHLAAQREQLRETLDSTGYSGFPVVDPEGVVVGLATRLNLNKLVGELSDTVDVGRVTDFHHISIQASMPLEVAFNLFKRMELNHIVVVDRMHHPQAVLTRCSLLPWVVQDLVAQRGGVGRATIQRPRNYRTSSEDVRMEGDQLHMSSCSGDGSRPGASEGGDADFSPVPPGTIGSGSVGLVAIDPAALRAREL